MGNQANISPSFPKPERRKLLAPIDYSLWHDYFGRLDFSRDTEKTLFASADSNAKRSGSKRANERSEDNSFTRTSFQTEQGEYCKS
jgi:hypothetical protein